MYSMFRLMTVELERRERQTASLGAAGVVRRLPDAGTLARHKSCGSCLAIELVLFT